MDIQKIIAEFRAELECLDEVIASLEKLSLKRTPRRGRPPAWARVHSVSASKKHNGWNGIANGSAPLAASAELTH